MTSSEFNKKYALYLADGHYGCDLGSGEVIDYLDKEFEELIKIPGFMYTQIKLKFDMGRFYCDNVPKEKVSEIEEIITKLCNNE